MQPNLFASRLLALLVAPAAAAALLACSTSSPSSSGSWSCSAKGKCPNDTAPTADQVNTCQQAVAGCCGDKFQALASCEFTNEQCDSMGNIDMQATANQCGPQNSGYVECVTMGCAPADAGGGG